MPSSCLATSTCLLGYRWLYVSIVVCTFSPGRNSSGYLLSCFLGGLAADVTFLPMTASSRHIVCTTASRLTSSPHIPCSQSFSLSCWPALPRLAFSLLPVLSCSWEVPLLMADGLWWIHFTISQVELLSLLVHIILAHTHPFAYLSFFASQVYHHFKIQLYIAGT